MPNSSSNFNNGTAPAPKKMVSFTFVEVTGPPASVCGEDNTSATKTTIVKTKFGAAIAGQNTFFIVNYKSDVLASITRVCCFQQKLSIEFKYFGIN